MLNLNPHQEAFASWDPARGNLRVQASAGAGKTAALVEFVARQIAAGVPAEAVVVLTFTNKAAGELRERIMERLGRPLEGLRIGTFHSIALSEVRASEDSWRYQSDRLLDSSGIPVEGRGLVTSLKLWSLILGRGPVPGTGGDGLKLGHDADPWEYAGWADRFASSKMHPGWLLEGGKSFDEITQLPKFTAAWSRFEQAKRQLKAWQFSDCLAGWLILLKRRGKGILGRSPERRFAQDGPEEPSGIRAWDPLQGHLVVVDEVQDNSLIQWDLARRLATPHGRIVCVGDSRQCQPAGTKVLTPTGEVPIEDLRDGDEVMGWREAALPSRESLSSAQGYGTVVLTRRRIRVARRPYTGLMYHVGSGVSLTSVTDTHRFRVLNREGVLRDVPADRLTSSMFVPRLEDAAGGVVCWNSVFVHRIRTAVGEPVYSLDVEEDHTYIADGVCGSNSIYGWRGAKVELFLRADDALEATTIDLPVNYRSRRRIVGLGNAIVRGTDWALGSEGQAATEEPGEVHLRAFETPEDEALDVVRAIREDLAAGTKPGQIAVLARTNIYALRAGLMLGLYGIPIRVLGRKGLLSDPAVGAFFGWVLASRPDAVVPPPILSSMLNTPQSFLPRWLKDELAKAVTAQGLDAGIMATRRMATEAHHKRAFDTLRDRIDHLREHPWPASLHAVATMVGGQTDPDKQRQKEDAARRIVDPSLAELVAGTRDEDPDGRSVGLLWVLSSLGEYFPDVYTYSAQLQRIDTQNAAKGDGVAVGTCHGVKGLEFDFVYGLGLSAGVFPSSMARTEKDFEEERRLLYVLATRPRHRLQLSWSESIYRAGKLVGSGPSSLVESYVRPALEADEQAEVFSVEDPVVVAARQAKARAVVAEGIRVGLDVGMAEGVRAGMVAGVGAMVREALATEPEGPVDGD